MSRKWTLEFTQERYDFPHNLGVRAIAQMHGPRKAVRKRTDNEPVVFEAATGANVGAVAEEEEMERLLPKRPSSRGYGFFGLAMDCGQKSTAEVVMQGVALSAQPNQVTK